MGKIKVFSTYLLVYITILSCISDAFAVEIDAICGIKFANNNVSEINILREMAVSNYIISNARNDQKTPIITYNNKRNEYLIVWNDERNSGILGKDIFAKILDSKLEPKSDELPINVSPNDQWIMDVAYNDIDDQYLIIWYDASTNSIQGQIVSSSGGSLGGKISIASSIRSYTSSLAFNSRDGKYLVIWDEGDVSQNSIDVYGQILSKDGTHQGNKFPITKEPYNQYNPVIIYNSNDDEFLAVWQDERNTFGDVKYANIFCKRITGLGQVISNDILVSDVNNDDYKQLPRIAYNKAKNEYFIVWTQGKSLTSMDIYGRLVKSNGTIEGNVIALCSAYGKQSNPDVVYNDEDMEYLIVWEDGRGANSDIYGQRLSQIGQLLDNNFAISTGIGDQIYPKITFNSIENNYLAVWSDNRNKIVSGEDIYAQIIKSPSLLLEIKPNILYADGKSTANVTLTLKGIFGEPLGGEYIDIKVTKGKGTISDIKDNGDGTYTAIYTASNQIGVETITVIALNKTKTIDITLIGTCRKGDINGDGIVNVKDAIMALQFIVNLITLTEIQKCSADVNGDGEVKADDVMNILQMIVGMNAPEKDFVKTENTVISVGEVQNISEKSFLVSIIIDNPNDVVCGEMSVVFNNSVIKVNDVLSDSLLIWNPEKSGILRMAFANFKSTGQKVIATIKFDIIQDGFSPIDLSNINLYNSSGRTLTPKVINGEFQFRNDIVARDELFQNFPNPFNPETWIPYQLKYGNDVKIKIFNINGNLIRELDLGYKHKGAYISQDRSAYWDGKDKYGRPVASGVYFYSIQAGDFFATKKMIVIR